MLEQGGPSSTMTGVFIQKGKRGHTHTQRTAWEDEDRWGDPSTSQGTHKVASKSLEASTEAWDTFSLSAFEGTNPAHTLILDF